MRYILVLLYKMLINRISLRSRAGPDPLRCEAAEGNFRVYDPSKLVEMGEIRVFSSLRSPFLVKIPFPLQKENVDPLDFISFYLSLSCRSGNPPASPYFPHSCCKLGVAPLGARLGETARLR